MLAAVLLFTGCHVSYSLRNVSIPAEVKTVKITYFENKARYVNPQLSPKLTDKLTQTVAGQTRLTKAQAGESSLFIH